MTKRTIPLVYILSPYTHHSPRIRAIRARIVTIYTGRLMRLFPQAMFYSPIAYCHPLVIAFDLPPEIEYWEEHSRCMIHRSQLGIILNIKEWRKSDGIKWEVSKFEEQSTPVIHDILEGEHEVVGQALQKLA